MDKGKKKGKNVSRQKKDTFFSSEKLASKQSTSSGTPESGNRQEQSSVRIGSGRVTGNLPNVQSKETILTEFGYSQMFAKRKLESNWSKYDELPEDEDNEQMLAANFEDMLLGPKTIGSHFTFSSEKHWANLDDESQLCQAIDGLHEQLFKLDLNLLKSGITSVPFDLRLGYSQSLFDANELTDINCRAGCFDRYVEQATKDDINLVLELQKINDKLKTQVPDAPATAPDPVTETTSNRGVAPSSSQAKSAAPAPGSSMANTVSIPPQSIENIQGWLDDILNDS